MIMTMTFGPLSVIMGIIESTKVLMTKESMLIVKFEGVLSKIERKNATY